ncbi:LysR family transcriptional regulator [Amycolatopsis sp. CA-230715]|uniref:LysR family transcriptional regulator n=1 Tax=Amycolatopsis sp. CA-230715 TaxID=2745196 RepID=UPI001C00C54C|nr:LysR family transcriptional regulator [Amycolatopsis sp. CA-230715]QWF82396.1 HTH-type transcriptional regulator GltC [Amycolatopsis sp. CA-230715]
MPTLRQLEYLVTIIDERSFTRAAEILHVTQSALSHQVKTLERVVGGRLVERLPRGVRATPLGRAMLPHARAALAGSQRAEKAARQAAGLEAGELEVASVYSVTLGVLPPVLRAWRRAHPEVHIRLVEHRHADELEAAMVAGEADVAVGPSPSAWDGPVWMIGEEEFVVVLAPDDEAPQNSGTVALGELADRGWVHYAPGNGLGVLVDKACAAAGFTPRASVRTEQTAAAHLLAAAGLGPALVPANVIPARFSGRVLRPSPPVVRALAVYARKDPDPVTAAFAELVARKACVLPAHVKRQLDGQAAD